MRPERIPPECPSCEADSVPVGEIGWYPCSDEDCNGGTDLRISKHAKNRWRRRSADPELNPMEAWTEGWVVPRQETIPEDSLSQHELVAHEIRYHHPSRMTMLRKNHNIVTVIDTSNARKGIRFAAIEACVREGQDPRVVGELCHDANIEVERFRELAQELRTRVIDEEETERPVRAEAGNASA